MIVIMLRLIPAAALAATLIASPSYGQSSAEIYGKLPEVSQFAISPAGRYVGYRVSTADAEVIAILDVETRQFVASAGTDAVKPRNLYFIDDENLLLFVSNTTRSTRVRGAWENSAAWLLNVSDQSLRQLLNEAKGLYSAQSGLGRVVGVSPDGGDVYMPAFTDDRGLDPRYSLYRASTKNTRVSRIVERGNASTIDWFVDADGEPYLREDFDDEKNLHRIFVLGDGDSRVLYEAETAFPKISAVGLSANRDALYFVNSGEDEYQSLYRMTIADGSIEGPLFDSGEKGIESMMVDRNRILYGVRFEGFHPQYAFFDKTVEARVQAIQNAFPGASTSLESWSDDFADLVVRISGEISSGTVLLFADGGMSPMVLAQERPAIGKDMVAPVRVDSYVAGDGLEIPALITARQEVSDRGNAPLIVLVHGGPAANDRNEFDWLAQFFAAKGYVVLQPQYRGSTGFGRKLREAGWGEYGGKMQSDLDDGVRHLVEEGLADASRVCIVGASYGGYAALAAGAFSPEMYACHVSINGVADLETRLARIRREEGSNSNTLEYWLDWYGVDDMKDDRIGELSPVDHADAFIGATLLVHGRDDTVVVPRHSRDMEKALRRADKPVEFVELRGEDHFLSLAETRIETLAVVGRFVDGILRPKQIALPPG